MALKDQDKDKDLASKDQDKDKDLASKDKDKDLNFVLKDSLKTRTRTNNTDEMITDIANYVSSK